MKKLLETKADPKWGYLVFTSEEEDIRFMEFAGKMIIEGCDDKNIYPQGGVLVYMTQKEYDEISKKF